MLQRGDELPGLGRTGLITSPPEAPPTVTPPPADALAAIRQASHIFERASDSLSASFARHPYRLLAGLSVLYCLGTCALAWSRLLWFDEILTFHLARLPGFASLWSALQTGVDLNPPLYFMVAHWNRSLFGESELAMRVPVILGFWVLSLCLFRFVSRSCSPLFGLTALFLPVVTTAYKYAFEARPYGLVLGLCGVALVAWQSYVRNRSRAALALMSVALSLAVLTHYYALLAFLPFLAGEIVRVITQRKFDPRVIMALVLAGLPLLFCLPLMRTAKTFAATYWAKPELMSIYNFYEFLLAPALIPLLIALVGLVTVSKMQVRRDAPLSPESFAVASSPITAEVAVGIGFILLPTLAVLMAFAVHSGFTSRYALPSVIGVGVLVPMGAYMFSRGRPAIGAALALVFLAGFCFREFSASRRLFHAPEKLEDFPFLAGANLPKDTAELPVVIIHPLQFIKIAHYGPAEWKRKAAYVMNLPVSVRYGVADTADRGLLALRALTPLNIFEYSDFVRRYPKFLVQGPSQGWLIRYLVDVGADIRVLSHYNGELLYQVQPRASHP